MPWLAQQELETGQRTVHLGKQLPGAYRSRGVVMRIVPSFDIRLDMIVSFFFFAGTRGAQT